MSQALATLYGLKRVERASAFLLAAGALTGVDVAALRSQVHNGFSHSSSLDSVVKFRHQVADLFSVGFSFS